MLRTLLILLITISVEPALVSCAKDEGDDQAAIDKQKIETYLAEKGLEAEMTASGLFYIIHNAGDNRKPNIGSQVTVAYKGYFLDGVVFDQSELVDFRLGNVIKGWQEGIPLIGEGGSITLLVPSALAYGSRQQSDIPPNSVLIFDITLFYFTK
jgi:FKBP-type peptidyl-prolyl cis-trans isomerase